MPDGVPHFAEDGEGEGRRFSCPGLRGAAQVFAFEDDGDGAELDGARVHIAHALGTVQNRFR